MNKFTVKNFIEWINRDLDKKHMDDEILFYDKTNEKFLNIYNFEVYVNGKVAIQLTDDA